jgi:hypothetical protein
MERTPSELVWRELYRLGSGSARGRGHPPSWHPAPWARIRAGYLMCTPEMARAMISRWISLVPSKMV